MFNIISYPWFVSRCHLSVNCILVISSCLWLFYSGVISVYCILVINDCLWLVYCCHMHICTSQNFCLWLVYSCVISECCIPVINDGVWLVYGLQLSHFYILHTFQKFLPVIGLQVPCLLFCNHLMSAQLLAMLWCEEMSTVFRNIWFGIGEFYSAWTHCRSCRPKIHLKVLTENKLYVTNVMNVNHWSLLVPLYQMLVSPCPVTILTSIITDTDCNDHVRIPGIAQGSRTRNNTARILTLKLSGVNILANVVLEYVSPSSLALVFTPN